MKVLNLCIHGSDSQRVEREQVATVKTPQGDGIWRPIPHIRLLDGIQKSLERSGLRIVQEAHALAREGDQYFGLFQVANGVNHDDYSVVVGLRNSHDKAFSAGLVVGSGVFVCDNLSFSGEIKIARKHTTHINRDLPNLIERAVGRLGDLRHRQDTRIESYKRTDLSSTQVHDLLIQSLDARVVPASKIPAVLAEYREPRHVEFAQSANAWRLFNAYTETLKGSSLFRRPAATQALHGLLDTACGLVGRN